jgi:hypothetical protein
MSGLSVLRFAFFVKAAPAYRRGFDRKVISSGASKQLALTVGSKGEASFNVFGFQIRKISENFFLRHTRSQILKHFVDGYAQTTDAGLSTRFPPSMVIRPP